jgi:hypothetical protein
MRSFDALHMAIAFIPLATYLLVLGMINLSRRPMLTTGIRDSLALALGLAGLMVAGPMELFLPERAAQTFGAFVWLLMLALYWLICLMIILMRRPRLVIYNISIAELRPALEKAIKEVDLDASWTEDVFVLPRVYVQLNLENFPSLRNITLASVGPRQSWQGWRELEVALAKQLQTLPGSVNPYGLSLVAMGSILAAVITFSLARQPQEVTAALWEMLRL